MDPCLFCDIAAGKIPCDEVFSDDQFLAFRDISPQAPVHVLLIPREHISGLTALAPEHETLMGKMMLRATKIAAAAQLAPSGYRFVINCGGDGGQLVGHLHLHILGGRALSWPPG